MGIRRSFAVVALTTALGAGVGVASSAAPVAADTATVDYTCDLPPAGGLFGGEIPDTVVAEDLEVTIADTPDPVVVGHPVHYDIDFPVLDLSEGLPPAPPEIGSYGIMRVKYLEVTATVPAGLGSVTAAFETQPAPPWATISLNGTTLKVRVQSPVAGSYIEIDPDVTPTTVRIQTAPGVWADLDSVPPIDVVGIATAAAGTTVDWRPPRLDAVVKYSKQVGLFGALLNINWNDAPVPCTPNDPDQVVVSTLVEAASPTLSVDLTGSPSSVEAGETVEHTVTVTNTGNVALSDVVVDDGPAGCTGAVGGLAVDQAVGLTCQRVTTLDDVGELAVTASADAAETEPVTSAPARTEVRGLPAPQVTITPPTSPLRPGDLATYVVSVTNEAVVLALSDLTVVGDGVACAAPPADLAATTVVEVGCTLEVATWHLGQLAPTVRVDAAEVASVEVAAAPVTVALAPHGHPDVPVGAYYAAGVDYAAHVGLTRPFSGNRFRPAASATRAQVAGMAWELVGRPSAPRRAYRDVPGASPYRRAIDWVAARRLLPDTGARRFRPGDPVTRCHFAQLAWKVAGSPRGAVAPGYTDVPPGHRCRAAVTWARASGMLDGLADGSRFRPRRAITRGEAVQVLHLMAATESAWDVAPLGPVAPLFDPTD